MAKASVLEFPQDRKASKKVSKPDRLNENKKGRVFERGAKLWVDFYYMNERVREPSGLDDTQRNRAQLRKQLDLILAEIDNGVLEFSKRFPNSKKREHFALLEGRRFRKDPSELLFKDYVEKWWKEMESGMSANQCRDYASTLKAHILPFFGGLLFSDIGPMTLKKFIALLKSKTNRYGNPLSGKTIRNYLNPLRTILRDAYDEFGWDDLKNPFSGLKLPAVIKKRVQPLSYQEWSFLMEHMTPWYRPYFEFAVQTGLRPSEQVALRWNSIDESFIYIELSRVRKLEKADLKTEGSIRRLELRPSLLKTLKAQWKLTKHLNQPYVFINSQGGPIQQENLGKLWRKALHRSNLPHRRMYETRHTFASWGLAAGESPEWVARSLGHTDTTMVFKTYGRYIPNLTRLDGSAFERRFS